MRTIVVNLPVRKLEASEAFFSELGFTFNPEFSDDKTACMVVADNAFVMLIEQERFCDFIVGEISDATTTEVVTSVSAGKPRAGRCARGEGYRRGRKAVEAGHRRGLGVWPQLPGP